MVVLEGDMPIGGVDLRVYVTRPLGPGQTLPIRQLRDHAQEQQDKLHVLQRLLDQPDGIQHWLAHTIGEPALAVARQHPGLLEEARAYLRAGIDRAQALLAELNRLRTDREVFDDVLGWRGRRTLITAVTANLSEPKDPGTRKAVARASRTIRGASQP